MKCIDASDLALAVLRDFADQSGALLAQDMPFDSALLAAVHNGGDPLALVTAAREVVPDGTVLGHAAGLVA